MGLHRPGRGRGGKPDPQGARLYKWQWDWDSWGRPSLSLQECQEVCDAACKLWSVPLVPVANQSTKRDYSAYDDANRSIKLLRCHQNAPMALHEIAHHIVDVKYGTAFQDHGAAFVGVFADLLIVFKVAPKEAILGSLKARNIDFKLPKTVKKKAR